MELPEAQPWDSNWERVRSLGSSRDHAALLVVHRESGRQGVLKQLTNTRNRYARANMAREIVNLNSLHNARCAVPKVLDKNTNAYEAKDEPLYFVREYVDAPTVGALIRDGGPWRGARTLRLLERIARSLRIAFGMNIIHGDLRPENVLVTDEDQADILLLNYGLTFDQRARTVLTGPGESTHHPFIELPEQFLHEDADLRSDITGLVGLAYFCITGEAPGKLVGNSGRAPHQRDPEGFDERFDDPKQIVAAHAFFEQGFARDIDERFESLDELLTCFGPLAPPEPDEDPLTAFGLIAKARAATKRIETKESQHVLAPYESAAEKVLGAVEKHANTLAAGLKETAFALDIERTENGGACPSVHLLLYVQATPATKRSLSLSLERRAEGAAITMSNAGETTDLLHWSEPPEHLILKPVMEAIDSALADALRELEEISIANYDADGDQSE